MCFMLTGPKHCFVIKSIHLEVALSLTLKIVGLYSISRLVHV